MTYTKILERLRGVTRLSANSRNEYKANCPAHEDTNASLELRTGDDGRLLMRCHAGCSFAEIIGALGVDASECFPENGAKSKMKIAKTYDYCDENGEQLYQTVRLDPKDFRQRRRDPDKSDSWKWNLEGVRRVLYRLPELRAADQKRAVFVVEGEKDVDRLLDLGLVATCSVGGAGKWRDDYAAELSGRNVIVIPDEDPIAVDRDGRLRHHEDGRPIRSGWDHAIDICESLSRVDGCRVRLLWLKGLPEKGDVSDWLDANEGDEGLEKLRGLVRETPRYSKEQRWYPFDRPDAEPANDQAEPPAEKANQPRQQEPALVSCRYVKLAKAILAAEPKMDPDTFGTYCRGLIEETRDEARSNGQAD